MNWIDIDEIAQKDVLSKLVFNILKITRIKPKLHENHYPLAQDKIEIKRLMPSEYQLKLLIYTILLLLMLKN